MFVEMIAPSLDVFDFAFFHSDVDENVLLSITQLHCFFFSRTKFPKISSFDGKGVRGLLNILKESTDFDGLGVYLVQNRRANRYSREDLSALHRLAEHHTGGGRQAAQPPTARSRRAFDVHASHAKHGAAINALGPRAICSESKTYPWP